jgi:hypothetical protein
MPVTNVAFTLSDHAWVCSFILQGISELISFDKTSDHCEQGIQNRHLHSPSSSLTKLLQNSIHPIMIDWKVQNVNYRSKIANRFHIMDST